MEYISTNSTVDFKDDLGAVIDRVNDSYKITYTGKKPLLVSSGYVGLVPNGKLPYFSLVPQHDHPLDGFWGGTPKITTIQRKDTADNTFIDEVDYQVGCTSITIDDRKVYIYHYPVPRKMIE